MFAGSCAYRFPFPSPPSAVSSSLSSSSNYSLLPSTPPVYFLSLRYFPTSHPLLSRQPRCRFSFFLRSSLSLVIDHPFRFLFLFFCVGLACSCANVGSPSSIVPSSGVPVRCDPLAIPPPPKRIAAQHRCASHRITYEFDRFRPSDHSHLDVFFLFLFCSPQLLLRFTTPINPKRALSTTLLRSSITAVAPLTETDFFTSIALGFLLPLALS